MKLKRRHMLMVAMLSWLLTFMCVHQIVIKVHDRAHHHQVKLRPHGRAVTSRQGYVPPAPMAVDVADLSTDVLSFVSYMDLDNELTLVSYIIPLLSGSQMTFTLCKVTHDAGSESEPYPEFLQDAAAKYSDSKRNIVLIPIDEDEMELAVNFYEASLARVGISNYCFLVSDLLTFNVLRAMDINAFLYSSAFAVMDLKLSSSRTWYSVVYELLLSNYNVFIVNPYNVILRNPFKSHMDSGSDISVAWLPYVSTNFLFLKPVSSVLDLVGQLLLTLERSQISKRSQANSIFAALLAEKQGQMQPSLGFHQATFRSGKIKYDGRYSDSTLDTSEERVTRYSFSETCHVILDTELSSKETTQYLLRESQLWWEDKDGYYSDLDALYLTYGTPRVEGHDVVELQMKALQNALGIGMLLRRKVILPEFTCKGCQVSSCLQPPSCLLNAHLHFPTFHRIFAPWYRESSFLSHPKVPSHIQPGPRVTLVGGLDASLDDLLDGSDIVIFPNNSSVGVITSDIYRHLRNITNPVIHFTSLYDNFVGFSNPQEQNNFRGMLAKGFRNLHFRQ